MYNYAVISAKCAYCLRMMHLLNTGQLQPVSAGILKRQENGVP